MNIDLAEIEHKITPKTKGIIPVHLYGHLAEMEPINGIARKHGLWVVENAAEARSAEVSGRKVGSMGTCATFSFLATRLSPLARAAW